MTWVLDYPVIRAATEVFGSARFLDNVLPGRIVATDVLADQFPSLVGGVDVVAVGEFDDAMLGDPAQPEIISLLVQLSTRLSDQSSAAIAWAEVNAATCIVDERAAQQLCKERDLNYRSSVYLAEELLKAGHIDAGKATLFLDRVFEIAGTQGDATDVVARLVTAYQRDLPT